LARKILSGDISRIPNRYSEDLQNIIAWMTNKTATKRPSVEELMQIPKIQLRLSERKMREDYAALKKREQDVHE
jgi:NIMA (never in mitosis gene a)-related kinase